MVSPASLVNFEVRRWLNGVEPAWTILDFNSFNALHDEPSASNDAIRLEANLPASEISGSVVTANTLLLLQRAAEGGGLKLTATGNLSRSVVQEMCGIIEWPDYDKDELVRYYKVINEPDFLPLHFVRNPGASGEAPPDASRKAGSDAVGQENSRGRSNQAFAGDSFPCRLLAHEPWLF
jgi:hypothetical protein